MYTIFSSNQHLSQAVTVQIAQIAAQAVAARGRFTVAFSGGSLPQIVCPPLTAAPLRTQINWPAWQIFFADERMVPLDHPESNYRLLRQQLLDLVPISAAQVFAVDVTHSPSMDATGAAAAYAQTIARVLPTMDNQPPAFDLILLGMGPDGHTASLFPDHPLLAERTRWVAPILDAPKPPPQRITLTLPVINQARHVFFVATGANKAEVLPLAFSHNPSTAIPASLVHPVAGAIHWFVDAAAGAKLA